jgi:predicted GNAT family acetyltransferase
MSIPSFFRDLAKYARTVGSAGFRIVNLNLAFDLAVACAHDEGLLDLVFDLYDEGYFEDVGLREQLLAIASGSLGWSRKHKTPAGTFRKMGYSLGEIAEERLGMTLDKVTWRTGYAKLAHVPLAEWPKGAIDYGVTDAEVAGLCWFSQRQDALLEGSEDGEIPDSVAQARYAWGLHLASVWGVRTDPKAVFSFKASLLRSKGVLQQALQQIYVTTEQGDPSCSHVFQEKQGVRVCSKCGQEHSPFVRQNGKKVLKAIRTAIVSLCRDKGIAPKLTETGVAKARRKPLTEEEELKYVSTSAEDVEDLLKLYDVALPKDDLDAAVGLARDVLEARAAPSTFAGLVVLSWYAGVEKLLTTYLPALEQGTKWPINARYRTLVETGRASCSNPNLMNLPKAPGVRECYVPRKGFVYCSVDYEALELHTLAQVCVSLLGESALGEALNQGLDPHLLLAVDWLIKGERLTYDEAKKIRKDETHPRHKEVVKARNIAKAANFGLPGGLGAEKFVSFCKQSGISITLEEARELKEAWLKQWPEMRRYFLYIKSMLDVPEDAVPDEDGNYPSYVDVEQIFSGRVRGKTRYTAACNSYFQGLAADGAKLAVYEIAKACYRSDGSLRGSRLVVFVHDETIMEHPDIDPADRHRRAMEQARIMVDCMRRYTPDVRPKAEPALMRRWIKEASAKYDENGYLVPYDDVACLAS